jgi:preprotein translocase subunit SecF
MFSQILGGVSVVLLIAALMLYGMWQKALAENEVLKSNVDTLQQAKAVQDATINSLTETNKLNAKTIQDYGNERNEIIKATQQANAKITKLRETEAKNALLKPFEAGLATDSRIRDSVLRFTGHQN